MLEFTSKNVRTWSMLGSRGTFGSVLFELAGDNEKIVALSADLCSSSGLDRFRQHFPARFINMGISEQNMIGVSAGIAANGFFPFATSFPNFIALRSCEQARHFLGYMNSNVKLVGLASGFSTGLLGVTHYGLEDIAALRAISNITIVSPADCTETAKATEALTRFVGPVYIRLTGAMNAPIVYKGDYDFEIGKAITLREGTDICLIAAGTMVEASLKAAKLLEDQGISCAVIDMHTIKPLDTSAVDKYLAHKLIVTVEEHSVIGGLGGAVAEYLSLMKNRPPHLIVGIPQGYPDAKEYAEMLAQSGLTPPQIAERVKVSL